MNCFYDILCNHNFDLICINYDIKSKMRYK